MVNGYLPDFFCSFKFSNKKKTFHLHFKNDHDSGIICPFLNTWKMHSYEAMFLKRKCSSMLARCENVTFNREGDSQFWKDDPKDRKMEKGKFRGDSLPIFFKSVRWTIYAFL